MADFLAGLLKEKLSEVAEVRRPVAKSRIQLLGIDPSVTAEEIMTALLEIDSDMEMVDPPNLLPSREGLFNSVTLSVSTKVAAKLVKMKTIMIK